MAEGLPSINACKGGLTGKMTTAKYRTMAASQSVAKRDSVRTSYKVLKMNEDTHVTPRTAELGQCHELANPVKPHQKEKPCSLISCIKYICKAQN